MDAAAIRSRRRVAANARASAAHLDAELMIVARKLGHHGVTNFIAVARQRCSATITEEYARDLLARGGYPDPKP